MKFILEEPGKCCLCNSGDDLRIHFYQQSNQRFPKPNEGHFLWPESDPYTVVLAWLCIIALAAPPSLWVSQLMEFHKPFVSPSVIAGQLPSLWLSLSARLGGFPGSQIWRPRGLKKPPHPQERWLSSNFTSLGHQGHHDVTAMVLSLHLVLFHLYLPGLSPCVSL